MFNSLAELSREDLINAFKSKELVLYYQPIFNLKTSKFEAVEALVRWSHPTHGLILPEHFLPVAAEYHLIEEMGDWVLLTACMQNKSWQEMGLMPIRIAVNVYDKQFHQNDYVDKVKRILSISKLNPKYLELEVAENTIIQADDKEMIGRIDQLRKMGVQVALDDFGMGYTSISHLKKVRVDRIKIDKSYIKNIHLNHDDEVIVNALITLSAGLNMLSLAEGVEEQAQLEQLIRHGCNEAQGYFFSEPLSSLETQEFLMLYQNNPFEYKLI